jgi:hypothetical protein
MNQLKLKLYPVAIAAVSLIAASGGTFKAR